MQLVLAAIGISLIITLGSFVQMWADDFCFLHRMFNHNALSVAVEAYKTWDGRFLSYLALGSLFKNSEVANCAVFFWILAFILSTYFSAKLLARNVSVWFYFILTIVFWLGFRRHISQSVYWNTGGSVYILTAFIGLVWPYLYGQVALKKLWHIFIWVVFSFIAGISSYGLSAALITYISFERLLTAYQIRSFQPFLNKKFILSFIFILIGTIIIAVAPGNFIRAAVSGDSFKGNVLINLFLVNIKFIGFGWPLIPLSFLFAVAFKDQISETTLPQRIQWLLTSLATASPLALLNSFTSPRTAIYFHFFFSIFLIFSFKTFLDKFRINFKLPKLASGIMACVFFFLIIGDNLQAYRFKKEYSHQINELEKMRNTGTAFIFKETPPPPKSLAITPFNKVSSSWENVCAANYYGLESIRLE